MTNIINFVKTSIPRSLFLALISIVIIAGLTGMTKKLLKLSAVREKIPFSFYGDAFTGLKTILKGEKYIGYYTDQDIKNPVSGARYEQLQLSLTPVIVDLNNTDHRFVIFHCDDEKECWRKIAQVHARPLKRSNTGIILAVTKP